MPEGSERYSALQAHLAPAGRAEEGVVADSRAATVLLAAKGSVLLLWRSGPALLACRGLIIDGIRPAAAADSAGFQAVRSLLQDRIAAEAVRV